MFPRKLFLETTLTFVRMTRGMQFGNLGISKHSDGTTHVIFEPVDFMARLAALVPKPRVNLTRYQTKPPPNAGPP